MTELSGCHLPSINNESPFGIFKPVKIRLSDSFFIRLNDFSGILLPFETKEVKIKKMQKKGLMKMWIRKLQTKIKLVKMSLGIALSLCLLQISKPAAASFQISNSDSLENMLSDYQTYQENFQSVELITDIEKNNYDILEDQIFPVILESFGEEEVTLIPAIEKTWHRLALFFGDKTGKILYKSNGLETNYCIRGALYQPVRDIAAVSFADVNEDGLTDLILITRCVNEEGSYAGIPYKVGDVLFQKDGGFYRDWRISDRINRFSMNKSANFIISYVRDGNSTEFLYTASTLDELLAHGFIIQEDQCYTRRFEKLGRLKVVPGIVRISEYDIFMIYLVNEQGEIVWSLQPMGDCDNLYSLKGINGSDVDGDRMKDLVVLARYSKEDASGEPQVVSRCSVYYQRTGGFVADTEFEKTYTCTEEDTMEKMIQKIREYWGWQAEE